MKLNNYMQVVVTYIGAVIGAGFISGQEILQFFVIYGREGLAGTILAGILFACLGISIVLISYDLQTTNYHSLFYRLGGEKLGILIDILFSLFLFGSLLVMLAGCKEVFSHFFTLSFNWGLVITLVVVVITNLYGLDGIMKLNSMLIPILLVISLLIIITINDSFTYQFFKIKWSRFWLPAPFVYVGYNLLLGLVVLLPLTTKIDKPELILGVGSGGLGLGLLAFLIGFTLYSFYPTIVNSELPMLELIREQATGLYYLYGLILWLAMVTTASCNLYGLVNRCLDLIKLNRRQWIAGIIIIILPIIRLPFSRLVELIYPWLGKVSLCLLAGVIIIYTGRRVYNERDPKKH